jgi:hypothetical protein
MIDSVIIQDYGEGYAPPEQEVLHLSASVDPDPRETILFMTIGPLDDTSEHVNFKRKTEIGVSLSDLIRALTALGLVDEWRVARAQS